MSLATNGYNACEDNPWTSLETFCPHFHVHFQGIADGLWVCAE